MKTEVLKKFLLTELKQLEERKKILTEKKDRILQKLDELSKLDEEKKWIETEWDNLTWLLFNVNKEISLLQKILFFIESNEKGNKKGGSNGIS